MGDLSGSPAVEEYGDVLSHHLDPPDHDPDDVVVTRAADREMSGAVTRAAGVAPAVGGVT
jgi:hypothetical protein